MNRGNIEAVKVLLAADPVRAQAGCRMASAERRRRRGCKLNQVGPGGPWGRGDIAKWPLQPIATITFIMLNDFNALFSK